MNHTITALFDTREDAEAGRQRLIAANVDADNARIHDKSSEGFREDSYSTTQTSGQGTGIWGSIKNAMLPDEDRHTYEEGVRRGGYILSADVDDDDLDRAVAALEESSCVDIDERAGSWRNEGWTGPQTTAAAFTGTGTGTGAYAGTETGERPREGLSGEDEQRLNVVEERLVVGKRETERGGVRVRSYVTETPVQEQIRLRTEQVNVERRPLDQRLDGNAADAFQERTVELTERSEEAVVGKEARIVEEVVVSKSVGERTEEINDTVRRTDVDVEQLDGTTRTGTERSAFSSGTTTGTGGETLREKAHDVAEDVKDGLGIGHDNR